MQDRIEMLERVALTPNPRLITAIYFKSVVALCRAAPEGRVGKKSRT